MNRDFINRFWAKVDKTDSCWNWTAATKDGYGRFNSKGYAHRISWELINGPIPAGIFVCHSCDNPSCVRPDHLFLGTNQDNVNDMIKKGRNSQPPSMGGWNKIDLPKEIISLLGSMPDTEIARIIGVNKSVIRRARNARNIESFPSQTRFRVGMPHPRWEQKRGCMNECGAKNR